MKYDFTHEILNDLSQILNTVGRVDGVIAITYQDGSFRAGVVLADAHKSGLDFHVGAPPALAAYISVVRDPEPDSSHWVGIPQEKVAIPLIRSGEDQCVAYLILSQAGQCALALAGCRDHGRVSWCGNAELIYRISNLLVAADLVNREPRRG